MLSGSPLSEWTNHFASSMCSDRPDERHRARRFLEMLSEGMPPPRAEDILRAARSPHFGPWEISHEDGVRWTPRASLSLEERHAWDIRPLSSEHSHPDGLRVLLVGESAAGSFGYWRDTTLAREIERALGRASRRPVEVIDLSCINALWVRCLEAIVRGATLKPDHVILFAGNNELKALYQRLVLGELHHLGAAKNALWALDTGGPALIAERLGALASQHFAHLVETTATLARHLRLPIYCIIPAYNDRDWQGPESVPADLPGARLPSWSRKLRAAQDTLDRGDRGCLAMFRELVAEDGEQCQASLFGLARAEAAFGLETAPERFRQAREAGLGPYFRANPQITTNVRSTIAAKCALFGIPTVDLEEVIKRDAPQGPDRTSFIDYCHLSHGGFATLAEQLTRHIVPSATRVDRVEPPQISPRDEAVAALVAALHNYHCGQPPEIVGHWLDRCIGSDHDVVPCLRFLARASVMRLRERLTPAVLRSAGLEDCLGQRSFVFVAKFLAHARFDHRLTKMILDRLGEGVAMWSWLEEEGREFRQFGSDLHHLYFLDVEQGIRLRGRGVARGGWSLPASAFDVVADQASVDFPWSNDHMDRGVTLCMDLSTPLFAPPAALSISLNGHPLGVARPGARPSRTELQISVDALRPLNTLSIAAESLFGLADVKAPWQRQAWLERYSVYPVAATLHGIRLCETLIDDPP